MCGKKVQRENCWWNENLCWPCSQNSGVGCRELDALEMICEEDELFSFFFYNEANIFSVLFFLQSIWSRLGNYTEREEWKRVCHGTRWAFRKWLIRDDCVVWQRLATSRHTVHLTSVWCGTSFHGPVQNPHPKWVSTNSAELWGENILCVNTSWYYFVI